MKVMKVAPVVITDLFPTRYEAFDNPGTIQVFKARDNGEFYHCKREKLSKIEDFVAPKRVELAVYHSDECHFEVQSCKEGYTARCTRTEENFWHRTVPRKTVDEAILDACSYLGLCPKWEKS